MDQIFPFFQLEYDLKGVPISGIEGFMHIYIYIYIHGDLWYTLKHVAGTLGVLLKQRLLPCNMTAGILGSIILIWTQGLPLP